MTDRQTDKQTEVAEEIIYSGIVRDRKLKYKFLFLWGMYIKMDRVRK